MLNVGILCGGFSSEFDISMKSAQTILNNFPQNYNPFLIEVRRGVWTVILDEVRVPFNAWDLTYELNGKTIKLDLAIVYIHGNPGENGKIQAYLEMKCVPFVNSGALASELSFDKWYCNQFLKGFGIPVAKSIVLKRGDSFMSEEIISDLGLPCFVKPSDSGSSFGISKVKKSEELIPAIEKAFIEGESLVIESFLDGVEVTCGVYRKIDGIYALPLTEIYTDNDFFDYDAKYLGKSQEITPARVSEEIKLSVQSTAKIVYELLNLKSIARIDFMLVNDIPFVIEVNTTPGFSEASLVPQMIHCDGNTIRNFWEEIFEVEVKGN